MKNKSIRSILLSFLLVVSLHVEAEDGLTVKLEQDKESFIIMLENNGEADETLNATFDLNPMLGPISFSIFRRNLQYHIMPQIESPPPDKGIYIKVSPGKLIGVIYKKDFIKKFYGMDAGCYNIQVIYKDPSAHDFNAYDAELESNTVKYCFN